MCIAGYCLSVSFKGDSEYVLSNDCYRQIYKCTCTHTYIYAYILHVRTYIIFMHMCIHAYTHTYVHTYICTYAHIYTGTCIHTYVHTYVHTHLLTYAHVCTYILHTIVQTARLTDRNIPIYFPALILCVTRLN